MTDSAKPTAPRRRAPGMSPEQRRAMIIQTALPLIAEYGAAVTTGRIARAAGIGEATIFRAFTDKDELLDACMQEAMRPDHALRELASISLDQPVVDRLAEAADALQAQLARIGAVAGSLHASGHRRRTPGSGTGTGTGTGQPDEPPGQQAQQAQQAPRGAEIRGMGRDESMAQLRSALAELLAPDADALRLPAEQISAVFLGMLFTQPRLGDAPELTSRQLAEVFLHGALTTAP